MSIKNDLIVGAAMTFFLFPLYACGDSGSTPEPDTPDVIVTPPDDTDKPDDTNQEEEEQVTISCGPLSEGWTNPDDYMTWPLQTPRTAHTYQIGDPEMRFDESKIDPRYETQMRAWMKAGCEGGIPHIETLTPDVELADGTTSTDINKAITGLGQNGGVILLKDGVHPIHGTIEMKSNIILMGESRDKTICLISHNTRTRGIFNFDDNVKKAGMYRMTIKGNYTSKFGTNYPKFLWNVSDQDGNDELELESQDKISVATVRFYHTKNCWIDDMNILNSADFAVACFGNNTTMRNLHIEGSYTKCGGGRGYFYVGRPYNLVTGCEVTHLRHISLQGASAEYIVLVNNHFKQEVSFHHGDKGNNLILQNNIELPADMPGTQNPNYFAIMGPWSVQHKLSAHPNFIFQNHCLEKNQGHGNVSPWSDDDKLYMGPEEIKPKNPWNNFPAVEQDKYPLHGTLYPVILD